MEFTKTYIRKIDREYNKILFDGSDFGTDSTGNVKTSINPNQMQTANDYLVIEMFWLTQEKVDEMTVSEYNKLLAKINELKSWNETKKKN